jgi:hypothetical protein
MYEENYPIAICEHHSGDAYSCDDSEGRIGTLGINLYPTLLPDGLPEPQYPYTHAILEATIEERMAAEAPCSISIDGELTGNTLNLDLTITKDDGADMPNPRVQVVISETNIPYSGTGYETMNFVTRDMIPDHLGTDITMDGNTHEMTISTELDESWDQNNIIIVVFVEDGSNHHVFQTARVNLTELGAALLPPTDLISSLQNNDVTLFWNAPATAPLSYKIYRNNEHIADASNELPTFTETLLEIGEHTYHVTAVYASGESEPSNSVEVNILTGNDPADINGLATSLDNYPNPFNPETTIRYTVKQSGKVQVMIYDMKGKLVNKLVDNEVERGSHTAVWNGKDFQDQTQPSGIYFVQLKSADFTLSRKIMLMK